MINKIVSMIEKWLSPKDSSVKQWTNKDNKCLKHDWHVVKEISEWMIWRDAGIEFEGTPIKRIIPDRFSPNAMKQMKVCMKCEKAVNEIETFTQSLRDECKQKQERDKRAIEILMRGEKKK